MRCDFSYCIYCEENICLLNETQINALGMCEECITVSLMDNEAILKMLKEGQRKDLETRRADGGHVRHDFG